MLSESGKLFGFGDNAEGQLGLGADDSQTVTRPQYIESLRVRNFKMLSCGLEHSAALTGELVFIATRLVIIIIASIAPISSIILNRDRQKLSLEHGTAENLWWKSNFRQMCFECCFTISGYRFINSIVIWS